MSSLSRVLEALGSLDEAEAMHRRAQAIDAAALSQGRRAFRSGSSGPSATRSKRSPRPVSDPRVLYSGGASACSPAPPECVWCLRLLRLPGAALLENERQV